MNVREIDHITLTVANVEKSLRFYHEVFDMPILTFDGDRKAVLCGKQKINFQELGHPHEPVAASPTPGSADLCIVVKDKMPEVINHLKSYYVTILEGPVQKTGAHGKITSVYVRDPDQNLIEISNY